MMNKLTSLLLGMTLCVSTLSANATAPSKLQPTAGMKQQEVDLNAFQNKEVLKMAVAELSKGVPQKIDKYTTLVDVTSKDLTLIYVYEINTGVKSDDAVRKEDHGRMQRAIMKGACKSSKRFLESGISLSYLYNSAASKAKLFQFDVSLKDCPAQY